MPNQFGQFRGGSFAAPRQPLELPHLHDFEGIDPRCDTDVFWRAPWLWPSMVRDEELVKPYVLADELPGNLPVAVIDSDDWRRRCVMATQDLWRTDPDEPLARTRSAFTKLVYQRMYRFPGRAPVPSRLGLDLSVFRTDGEIEYGYNLASLDWDQWRGKIRPRVQALCFARPILRADFRYVRRMETAVEYWERIKWERGARSRTGYLVPMHCIEIDMIRRNSRVTRYVALPTAFSNGQVEMPRGFLADLPPVLTYLSSVLIINYGDTGLWVVLYSEWVAKVASALLWEAYDNFRVWYTPPTLCGFIRDMDLAYVLGSTSNHRDVMHLVGVIESTNWADVPADWHLRGNRPLAQDASPGRHDASAGDFIYYDPWLRRRLNGPGDVEAARACAPTRPEDQLGGYVFDEEMGDQGSGDEVNFEDESVVDGGPAQVAGADEDGVEQRSERNQSLCAPALVTAPTGAVEELRHEEAIRQFLLSAGMDPSCLTGDVAALRAIVANLVESTSRGADRNSGTTEDAPLVPLSE